MSEFAYFNLRCEFIRLVAFGLTEYGPNEDCEMSALNSQTVRDFADRLVAAADTTALDVRLRLTFREAEFLAYWADSCLGSELTHAQRRDLARFQDSFQERSA